MATILTEKAIEPLRRAIKANETEQRLMNKQVISQF